MDSQKKYSFPEFILFPPTSLNLSKLKKTSHNKTILITGASFGVGESLAHLLANTGAHLILVARTEEKLISIKNEIEGNGGKVTIFSTDLSNTEQVQSLIQSLLRLPDGIDIVVSNAGRSIKRSITDSLDRYHDFTRTMAINYFGPVQLLLGLIPILTKNKGHVINVSTISVLMAPAPSWAAYQASKSAFDNWFRCAVPELNADGINTTSVYLPLVKTRMMAPTVEYRNMPAMSSDHVARIICKSITGKRRRFTPWWTIFGQLASTLFWYPWEVLNASSAKKKRL